MADLKAALDVLLSPGHEYGFALNDNGRGAVNWGWTSQTLADIGEPSDVESIRAMTRERAAGLYAVRYWTPLRLSEVTDQRLATYILSMCVNMQGPGKAGPAVRLLQEALNDVSRAVTVDGVMGPQTVRAVNALPAEQLLAAYDARINAKQERLARDHPERYADDLPGWRARRKRLTA